MITSFEQAAKYLCNAKCAIASTGAGISVESGIPDFRSAGGIWERYPPEEYATIEAFLANPEKVWAFWNDLGEQFRDCQPNPGHHALAALEKNRLLRAVITQNVDNLHQHAGSQRVIEYHGNTRRLACVGCEARVPFDTTMRVETPPRCSCGGLQKPDVVMFGELIPQRPMLEAEAFARTADVVLIVGTSAQVFPAAQLPYTAKRNDAAIIEVNKEETDFTREITDVFLQGSAGAVLPRLVETVLSGKT